MSTALIVGSVGVGLVVLVYQFLARGPFSMRAEFFRDVRRVTGRLPAPAATISESDVAPLPEPVQRYVRATGAIGEPRIRHFQARMRGRFRGASDAPWMPFTAEQCNVVGENGVGFARYFFMSASRSMIPFFAYHKYSDGAASMRVKVLGVAPVMNIEGPEMTKAETVTLFNDLCVMAPSALIDPAIKWQQVDANRVSATFSNAGFTIRADLVFDDSGWLVDFISDDRLRASGDGRTLTRARWSTPLRGRKPFGAVQLAESGEARWHQDGGTLVYIELAFDDVRYHR